MFHCIKLIFLSIMLQKQYVLLQLYEHPTAANFENSTFCCMILTFPQLLHPHVCQGPRSQGLELYLSYMTTRHRCLCPNVSRVTSSALPNRQIQALNASSLGPAGRLADALFASQLKHHLTTNFDKSLLLVHFLMILNKTNFL